MLGRKTLCSFVMVSLYAGAAFGAPIVATLDPSDSHTLASVMANGMLVGDKLFDDFRLTIGTDVTTAAPSADSIMVTGVQIGGDYGLRFNGPWSASADEVSGMTLKYGVWVQEPDLSAGWVIEDFTLWSNDMAVTETTGGGHISISANLLETDPDDGPATPVVQPTPTIYYSTEQTQFDLVDDAQFPGRASMYVLTGLVANGGTDPGGAGVAKVTEFYQTFSQIPEPATLGLMAAGALLVLVRRRKK